MININTVVMVCILNFAAHCTAKRSSLQQITKIKIVFQLAAIFKNDNLKKFDFIFFDLCEIYVFHLNMAVKYIVKRPPNGGWNTWN